MESAFRDEAQQRSGGFNSSLVAEQRLLKPTFLPRSIRRRGLRLVGNCRCKLQYRVHICIGKYTCMSLHLCAWSAPQILVSSSASSRRVVPDTISTNHLPYTCRLSQESLSLRRRKNIGYYWKPGGKGYAVPIKNSIWWSPLAQTGIVSVHHSMHHSECKTRPKAKAR